MSARFFCSNFLKQRSKSSGPGKKQLQGMENIFKVSAYSEETKM